MMSRQISKALQRFILSMIAGCFLVSVVVPTIAAEVRVSSTIEVRLSSDSSLFYFYNGEKIYLEARSNVVAVQFKPEANATRNLNAKQLYERLKDDLNQAQVRGSDPIDVSPLGLDYAIVKLPNTSRGEYLETQLQKQSYVQGSLPVLKRPGTDEMIVLPNEILVSFQATTSEADQKALLQAQNLEIIRPLRFTPNRYLVRSRSVKGTDILGITQRLNQDKNIVSASPNFIQVMSDRLPPSLDKEKIETVMPTRSSELTIDRAVRNEFKSDLFPLLWHLDSRSRRPDQPRTDVRAPEAWANSNGGKGVLVAVLDNLIQWDHPNLRPNLYETPQKLPTLMPEERYGWDFSGGQERQTCFVSNPKICHQGDPDTRINSNELEFLRPDLQITFQLSDEAFLKRYKTSAQDLQNKYPDASKSQIAEFIRKSIRTDTAGNFHGTQTAAFIAARPLEAKGIVGIAPNAKILPVRVGGLGRGIDPVAVIEGLKYAADRGADVINMSFGGLLPTMDRDNTILEVLQSNPKLVIVASSGNGNLNQSGFPALVRGMVSVGATTVIGDRAPYSNHGVGLDLVAPGGNTSRDDRDGVLTASGLGTEGFWEGKTFPSQSWLPAQDSQGRYQWTDGTSFASPIVAGIVALMKGEDPDRKLTRDQIIVILKSTASRQNLQVSANDRNAYNFLKSKTKLPLPGDAGTYLFGSGLVNAEAAVMEVKRSVK